jgi:hypothetical protein
MMKSKKKILFADLYVQEIRSYLHTIPNVHIHLDLDDVLEPILYATGELVGVADSWQLLIKNTPASDLVELSSSSSTANEKPSIELKDNLAFLFNHGEDDWEDEDVEEDDEDSNDY